MSVDLSSSSYAWKTIKANYPECSMSRVRGTLVAPEPGIRPRAMCRGGGGDGSGQNPKVGSSSDRSTRLTTASRGNVVRRPESARKPVSALLQHERRHKQMRERARIVHERGRSAHLAQTYLTCPPRPGGNLRSRRRRDCGRLEPRVTSAAGGMDGMTSKKCVDSRRRGCARPCRTAP